MCYCCFSDSADLLLITVRFWRILCILLVDGSWSALCEIFQRHVQLAVSLVRLESGEGVDHDVLLLWRDTRVVILLATRLSVVWVDLLKLLVRARDLFDAEELLVVSILADLMQGMHDVGLEVHTGSRR